MVNLEALDITYALFSLLPGYLTYWVFRRRSHEVKRREEYEVAIWSLLASAVSIGILYSGYVIFRSWGAGEIVAPSFDQLSVSVITLAYFPLLAVALSLGFITGEVVRYLNRKLLDRYTNPGVWFSVEDYVISVTRNPDRPLPIYILTGTKREIHGWLLALGDANHRLDLLIKSPKLVLRDNDGNITQRKSIGSVMYVNEDDISEIGFHTEPPRLIS
jgi:hypothetical protein